MVAPIKPEEVAAVTKRTPYDEAIAAINALIEQAWKGKQASISQREIVDYSKGKASPPQWSAVLYISRHWERIMEAYRANGWEIEYWAPHGAHLFGSPGYIFRPK